MKIATHWLGQTLPQQTLRIYSLRIRFINYNWTCEVERKLKKKERTTTTNDTQSISSECFVYVPKQNLLIYTQTAQYIFINYGTNGKTLTFVGSLLIFISVSVLL